MGVLSIIFAFLSSWIGLVLAIVAIYLGKQGQKEGLLKADKAVTFGIVGLILSIIMIIVSMIFLSMFWSDIMDEYSGRFL